MKKYFGVLSVVSLLLIANSETSFAATSEVEITKEKNTVTIELPDTGHFYEVYNLEELIYTGDDNLIELTLDEEVENFKIDIIDEVGEIADNYYLKIKNDDYNTRKDFQTFLEKSKDQQIGSEDPQELMMSENLKENALEAIISEDEIELRWSDFPSDYPYQVFRDGELIGTTTEEFFIDKGLDKGIYYNYQVVSALKMEEEYRLELESQLTEKGLTDYEIEEALKIEGSLNTIIEIPKTEILPFAKLPNAPKAGNFLIRYTTFIPQATVKNPNPFSNHNYFKGDNRSFSSTSSKYRTRADVSTKMTNGNSISLSKKVNETVGCKDSACKTVTGRKTASSSGITMKTGTNNTSTKTWNVRHDVGIPFSKAYPNINYFYEATLKKKPSLSVNGAHDKAPSHEMYIRALDGSSYVTLYTRATGSFSNLIPGMPQQHFKFSY